MKPERTDKGMQAHWSAAYAAGKPEILGWYQAAPDVSLELIGRAGSAPEARIIDVGGGASTLVDHLLAAGYASVTVLDLAANALAAAKSRLGPAADRASWIVADATDWPAAETYDIWHDRAVFHFLTDGADRRAYVKTLEAALAPGGQVVIATFATDGPTRCSGLPVVRYDAEHLKAELGPAFELVEQVKEHHATPSGHSQAFTYFRFTRLP